MTNFEKYKNEIEAVDYNFAFVEGKIRRCSELPNCFKCDFFDKHKTCNTNKFTWLYQEHIEQPKLTANAHEVLKRLDIEWVARDKHGSVFGYISKPYKHRDNPSWFGDAAINLVSSNGDNRIKGEDFSFIKWEDPEPWSVADLLKLEVCDE